MYSITFRSRICASFKIQTDPNFPKTDDLQEERILAEIKQIKQDQRAMAEENSELKSQLRDLGKDMAEMKQMLKTLTKSAA